MTKIEKDLEGSGRSLTDTLSRNFPGGNVENHEKSQSEQLVSRPRFESSTVKALPLSQPARFKVVLSSKMLKPPESNDECS
jgi:hypothetical protein